MDYGATEDIPESLCGLRQYGWRFDSIELKYVTKVLKIKYSKVSFFLRLSHHVSFDLFTFLPSWFKQVCKT